MKLSVAGFDLTVYRRPAGNDPMLVGAGRSVLRKT